MNLILSDKDLELNFKNDKKIKYYNLSNLTINNCMGCFHCWVKTPGKCIVRDDAIKIYPLIAKSENIIYVSKIKYGGYDKIMKTMLERAIPIQQAFIRILDNETHHIQRNVKLKKALIIVYGDYENEEKKIFEKLIERNAKNMNFSSYNILFIKEKNVKKIVEQELNKWKN